MGGERKDFINANHMDMCRFAGRDDEGYVKVRGVLGRFVADIRSKDYEERNREHIQTLFSSGSLKLIEISYQAREESYYRR